MSNEPNIKRARVKGSGSHIIEVYKLHPEISKNGWATYPPLEDQKVYLTEQLDFLNEGADTRDYKTQFYRDFDYTQN